MLVACRPIAELTHVVATRDPHGVIHLQHHAVPSTSYDCLGACAHDRWRNTVDGYDGMMEISAIARIGSCLCLYLWVRGRGLCVIVCVRAPARTTERKTRLMVTMGLAISAIARNGWCSCVHVYVMYV